jgi:hypothetical protein
MHNSVVCIEYLDGQSDDSEKRDILNFIAISTMLEPYMNAKACLSLPIEISDAEDTPILTLVPEPVTRVAARTPHSRLGGLNCKRPEVG